MKKLTLYCKNVIFHSPLDEAAFLSWLTKLPCPTQVKREKNNFTLNIDIHKPLTERDFLDFFGFLERYKVDVKQLAVLKNESTKHWFYNPRWTEKQCFCKDPKSKATKKKTEQYSPQIFGRNLLSALKQELTHESLGRWCFRQYLNNKDSIERALKQTIINLSQMECNAKFQPKKFELMQIAEKLIKNEKVDIYVPPYDDDPRPYYTKEEFGQELLKKVLARESHKSISHWSEKVYKEENLDEKDIELEDLIERLAIMRSHPQLEIPYEKLEKIAKDLIEGTEVKV